MCLVKIQRKNSTLILLLIFIFSIDLLAETKKESEPLIVVEEIDYSGAQDNKWIDVQNDLAKLKTRVDQQRRVVEELLIVKRNNSGKVPQEQIDLLKKEHDKLTGLNQQYNKLLNDFQFQFPEKGLPKGRKYIRQEAQSLEELEKNLSFEGRLKKLTKKIKKQYKVDPEANQKTIEEERKNEAEKKNKLISTDPSEADITEQIILVK